MVNRILEEILAAKLGKGKAIILMGPRQVREYVFYQTKSYASKKWLTIMDYSKKNDLLLIGGIWLLPRCCNEHRRRKNILKQLSGSYLYNDILMWEQIKKPDKLLKLLQALAFQVGSQISFSKLGQLSGLDSKQFSTKAV